MCLCFCFTLCARFQDNSIHLAPVECECDGSRTRFYQTNNFKVCKYLQLNILRHFPFSDSCVGLKQHSPAATFCAHAISLHTIFIGVLVLFFLLLHSFVRAVLNESRNAIFFLFSFKVNEKETDRDRDNIVLLYAFWCIPYMPEVHLLDCKNEKQKINKIEI